MKSNLNKSLMILAACGVLAGAASVASAADRWHRDWRRPVIVHGGPAIRVGIGIGVPEPVYVAPCPPPVVVVPEVVVRPRWRHEVIVREPVYRHRRW